jgi:hypothetical protein
MEHQQPSNANLTSVPVKGGADPEAIAKGYEPQDLKLRSIFVFIGGLAVTLFVVLSVIYAIMMALAAYDRSVYAPLQPSLEHQQLDSDDMLAMRERTEAELNAPAGVSEAGRAHMPIADAMEKALPMLLTKAIIQPGETETLPGSFEGHPAGTSIPVKDPKVWSNNMNNLNNQGNRFP